MQQLKQQGQEKLVEVLVVVADEIRKLSEQTGKATENIEY